MPSNGDHSPSPPAVSPSTAVTTPEANAESDNDIWASDGPDEDLSPSRPSNSELLSDLPTIRRQHMTDGYREGLAVGKAKVMQQGFDEGYPIGVQIALRVGLVLGVLEGCLASKASTRCAQDTADLKKTYEKAQQELSCSALLKDITDESIDEAKTIPPFIEEVIARWERTIFGL